MLRSPSPSAPTSAPPPAPRLAAAPLLAQLNARLSVPLWRAGELADDAAPTQPTGWPALDAVLPGGGWPQAGLTELLGDAASGELALLAPWLHQLALRDGHAAQLLWIAPPGLPCASALQALGLALPQLVLVTPASAADAAWAAEQALRSGSCAAVLLWSHAWCRGASHPAPLASAGLRRLQLAAQAGATPLMALRPASVRAHSSPAPLRLACTPAAGRQLAVDVFKRRGPPLAEPLRLGLPWPASARRAAMPQASDGGPRAASPALTGEASTRAAVPAAAGAAGAAPAAPSVLPVRSSDAVDRAAPAAPAAASPALVATGA